MNILIFMDYSLNTELASELGFNFSPINSFIYDLIDDIAKHKGAIAEPWPLEPIAWVAYAQFAGAAVIMLLLLIPLIKLVAIRRKTKKHTDSPTK